MGQGVKPQITRLRYVKSKDEEKLVDYCRRIGQRIQIYSIGFVSGKHIMWFVPGDLDQDVKFGDLDA